MSEPIRTLNGAKNITKPLTISVRGGEGDWDYPNHQLIYLGDERIAVRDDDGTSNEEVAEQAIEMLGQLIRERMGHAGWRERICD